LQVLDKHLLTDETPSSGGPNYKRIGLIVLALVVIGCLAVVAGFSVAFHRSPLAVIQGQLTPSPQELFHKDHILVLAEGLDYDYTDKDEEFSKQSRSDVIKAINLDFRTKNVYVVSIPRDMAAVLPSGREAKINEAQAEGGVKEAQAVIANWLGTPPFDRYVILRINTTKDLINAIGGIDINPKNSDALMGQGANGPIDYDDNWGHLHIHFKPGMQHMNGEQAVGYARFRHDWCADPCRIKRQEQVMNAAVGKLRSDKFNTLMHVGDLIGVFNRDVQTNLTRDEELSLAQMFAGIPKDGLHQKGIDYVDTKDLADGGQVIVPDETVKAKIVRNFLIAPPVPTPSPNASAVAAINPLTVRVDVENGTGIAGMAKRAAALLRQKGFTIGQISNAATSDVANTELHEHSPITFAGVRVRDALGKAAKNAPVIADSETPTPEASSAPESDVTLIVGQDLVPALTQQASTQP
jgi:polyisoprenyl-teichoic acid--peptidoglycan teichoic acid transferase